MMERWVQGVWLGKRFTTDEHVIGLEDGKVVRTRNVRPKSLEDTWNFVEIDKIKGQPWDPSVTLTEEKLAQERFPRIEDPRPAEEEYVDMPRSHMITKTDLTKAGGWTPGCRKCKAMKDGDHSRTNLAHSAECRARAAEILADDMEFRTKMKKAVERKEGARHVVEPFPKVQIGGSSSSGSAPGEFIALVVMDSVDVDIPMSDGAHATATASLPSPRSVTVRREAGMVLKILMKEWSPKFLQLPSVVSREDEVIAVAAALAPAAVPVRQKIRRSMEKATRS